MVKMVKKLYFTLSHYPKSDTNKLVEHKQAEMIDLTPNYRSFPADT